MYHCGSAPVLHHIAMGMYGAVIIDPPNLPPVDHEYLFVQSELYRASDPTQPVDYAKLRTMIQAGSPTWDVVDVTIDFLYNAAKDNLFEKIDTAIVDIKKVPPKFVHEYGIANIVWSYNMAYNKDTFAEGKHPKNWAEFLDTTKFPGRRSLRDRVNPMLEIGLLADGVTPDKLYPLDVDRALKSLAKIRNHILWGDTNAQLEQFMKDGQAVMGFVPDGRALAAIDNGAPIVIDYDQSMMTWSTMVVPRGAPNKDGAMQFLKYAMTPEAQAAVAMAYTYGPVTPEAYKMLPPDRAKMLSGGPQQTGKYFLADEKWWGENLATTNDKLNAWRMA